MPRQAGCCCGENKCCLYPGWYINNGYYYADDPPENANPAKALDRNEWLLNEVIIDADPDLTFVINQPFWECVDGVFQRVNGKKTMAPTGAHSFKVVGDPIEAGINVTIKNLLAFAYGSFVSISITRCDGALIFNEVYGVPNYVDDPIIGGYDPETELCDEIPDQEFDTDTLTIEAGFYTAFIGFYYGGIFGPNKDAVAEIDFGGFTVDNLCTKD